MAEAGPEADREPGEPGAGGSESAAEVDADAEAPARADPAIAVASPALEGAHAATAHAAPAAGGAPASPDTDAPHESAAPPTADVPLASADSGPGEEIVQESADAPPVSATPPVPSPAVAPVHGPAPTTRRRARPEPARATAPPLLRAALWRAAVAVPLLGGAAALADAWVHREVLGVDVATGLLLGLLAGVLVVAEREAAAGRARTALVRAASLALLGVLVAAVQAGYLTQVLGGAPPDAALAAVHADGWLGALDPSTLPVLVARACPFALVAVVLGRARPVALVVAPILALAAAALVLVTGLGALDEGGVPGVLPAGAGAWGLPTGVRAAAAVEVALPRADAPTATLVAALWAAGLDTIALLLAAALGDRLARWRPGANRRSPRPLRWSARALAAAAVLALAALVVLGRQPPPAWLVTTLVDAAADPLRRAPATRLLARLEGAGEEYVAPLAGIAVGDPEPKQRGRALVLLARLRPSGRPEAQQAVLANLGPGTDREVRIAALDLAAALGPNAAPLQPDLLREWLRSLPLDGRDHFLLPSAERALEAAGAPASSDLATHLEDLDREVALGAALALARLGVPDETEAALRSAFPRLLEGRARFGRRGDAWLRPALEELAALVVAAGKGLPLLLDVLEADAHPPQARLHVLRPRALLDALGAAPAGPELTRALRAAMDHEDWEVRVAAARALAADRPGGPLPDALPALLALLGDQGLVRQAAVAALGGHPAQDVVPPLARRLEADLDDEPAWQALLTLPHPTDAARDTLLRAAREGSPRTRGRAARVLGRLAAPDRLDVLLDLLAAGDPDAAAEAATALRRDAAADHRARAGLLAALDAAAPHVAVAAGLSLALALPLDDLDRSPDLPRIVERVRDAVPRDDGFAAIVRLGPRAAAAVPALGHAIVRAQDVHEALDALEAVGLDAPDALAALGQAARNEVVRAADRRRALALLASVGPRAAEVVHDVLEALVDPIDDLRAEARRVLARIDPAAVQAARDDVSERLARETDRRARWRLEAILRALDVPARRD